MLRFRGWDVAVDLGHTGRFWPRLTPAGLALEMVWKPVRITVGLGFRTLEPDGVRDTLKPYLKGPYVLEMTVFI
jgi:hypothetical protein